MIKLEQICRYVWINGDLIPYQFARIHVLTHSLHYSGSVFEGERAYNGKVFKLKEHTERLIQSAEALGLKVPYSVDEIIKAHEFLITHNNIKDAYIRPLIWCGDESLNITNPALSTNFLIASIPSMPMSCEQGVNLHVSRWRKAMPDSTPVQSKSAAQYNMAITSKKEAKALGYDDALLLDYEGFIAECTTTNIFFVKDTTLYTPIADRFLNGITRKTIIEIAKNLCLEVKEERLKLAQIEYFTGCFVTGTAIEVQNISSIDLGDKKILFEDCKIADLLKKEYLRIVRG
ncbi:Branched-chain amino acid aminotransferase [Rickettsia typhi str. Wilmington]|uniref:Probable branched-chain-amino-acid aminotransferase n=3 Tax=Rickettsia typhi TaxID=785 RepID=ILVE_RICTY|nr:RecName: Full=Probable branched-chain-amino-acid aminotransferase; Short=BCAT [Rickettsia typhi str. Wilmington]AAU03891.1 Branched-chain amino acid aminotransferase [Rickettsia typhi str. Wilmington]AFE54273.1 branched-chain amino acid aminotransferase [Rickettsia typhi str. TH1527]AFE55113.1 branched-chain amino acid aminotransferase [Rickettsia typhi str. B9991CWPP]CAC33721.1 IlvE protein [Rickettsia typhi] [Rickettsia typhi str. Wilmington]